MSVKVTVISGFLGAGKTTMIKKLLDSGLLGEQPSIIENEFGDIDIDAGRLEESGIEVRSILSGCICCSLAGDFRTALLELLAAFPQQRIIIEPTGVGRLSDVLSVIRSLEDTQAVALDRAMTIVDVLDFEDFFEVFGEFYKDQIRYADVLILSKTQLAQEATVQAVIQAVRKLNPKAAIIAAPWEELAADQILEAKPIELLELAAFEGISTSPQPGPAGSLSQPEHRTSPAQEPDHTLGAAQEPDHTLGAAQEPDHTLGAAQETALRQGAAHGLAHEPGSGHDPGSVHEPGSGHEPSWDHDSGHVRSTVDLEAWSLETMKTYEADELSELLGRLMDGQHGRVLRAKGAVCSPSRDWLEFDLTPSTRSVTGGGPQVIGRIVVIGSELNRPALEELFNGD